MTERIPTYVYAHDPITQAGIASQLRENDGIEIVALDRAEVALLAADEIDEETVCVIRGLQRNGCPRVVVVATKIDDTGLLNAVEAGACGMLRRSEASPGHMLGAIRAARTGDGTVPPDLLGRLLDNVGRLQRQVLAPRGLTFSGLTDREIDVLRLVADGLDTAEVAKNLSYSERTVKNVIQNITMRLHLRNRTHAVAYAIRQGLI